MRLRDKFRQPPVAKQYRIVVDRAGADDPLGQWIDRIVFEDNDQSAGAEDAPNLLYKRWPLRWRHMVQHRDGVGGIEALVGIRQPVAVIVMIGYAGIGRA